MVAYSFQGMFEDAIIQGFKRQTIRQIGKRRHARVGERVGLYVGMRTAQCRLIQRVTCTAVMAVTLVFERAQLIRAKTDGVPVLDLDAFAIRDGFADAGQMSAFWQSQHGLQSGVFDGVLIEWVPLPEGVQP